MKKSFTLVMLAMVVAALTSCRSGVKPEQATVPISPSSAMLTDSRALADTLERIAADCPGEVGIALIAGNDTIVVNNTEKYPLMSVFKLHQALSLCRSLSEHLTPLDLEVKIERSSLNPDTWSPMLMDYRDSMIVLSVADLMRYTLQQSDNNASNYMFCNMESVQHVDSFIATIIPRDSFRLLYTEEDMWHAHDKSYDNCTSPLGAALLMHRLFTDTLLHRSYGDFLRTTLSECATGKDRIVAPLDTIPGVTVAHKTGSGYRNADGLLMAHNDVAHIILPDNARYTLAVFVKDFRGTEAEASAVIARISRLIYTSLRRN